MDESVSMLTYLIQILIDRLPSKQVFKVINHRIEFRELFRSELNVNLRIPGHHRCRRRRRRRRRLCFVLAHISISLSSIFPFNLLPLHLLLFILHSFRLHILLHLLLPCVPRIFSLNSSFLLSLPLCTELTLFRHRSQPY